jgi:hypothetical protein
VADDDDERDDDDEDEDEDEAPSEKKPAAKASAKKPSAPVSEEVALLREIRDLVRDSQARQDRYLWMLLPVIAILLVIAIFQAVKL